MSQQRVNFDPAVGDQTGAALVKLDNNCADLDGRVSAAVTTAALTGLGLGASTATVMGNLDVATVTRFDRFINGLTSGTYPPSQTFGNVLTDAYASAAQYTQLAISVTSPEMAFRFYNASWSAWARVWHSSNTTVDANNFIKKA